MLNLNYGVGTQVTDGNKNEVWAFVASNNPGQAQLLKYNTITEDSIGRFDNTNTI